MYFLNRSFLASVIFLIVPAVANASIITDFEKLTREANYLYETGYAHNSIGSAVENLTFLQQEGLAVDHLLYPGEINAALAECVFMKIGVDTLHMDAAEQSHTISQFQGPLRNFLSSYPETRLYRVEETASSIIPISASLFPPCALALVNGGKVLLLRGLGHD